MGAARADADERRDRAAVTEDVRARVRLDLRMTSSKGKEGIGSVATKWATQEVCQRRGQV